MRESIRLRVRPQDPGTSRGRFSKRALAVTAVLVVVGSIPMLCDMWDRAVHVRHLMAGALSASVETRISTYETMARAIVIGPAESLHALAKWGTRDESERIRTIVADKVFQWIGRSETAVGILRTLSADPSELVRRRAFATIALHFDTAPVARRMLLERLAEAPDEALHLAAGRLKWARVMSTADLAAVAEELLGTASASIGKRRARRDSVMGLVHLLHTVASLLPDRDDQWIRIAASLDDSEARVSFLRCVDPDAISDRGREWLATLTTTDDPHVRVQAAQLLRKSREK